MNIVKPLNLKNPIIVALDIDDPKKAFSLAKSLKDCVGAYKVGPRLLLRSGKNLISDLANLAPVFVDQKFYDIPSVMLGALQACFDQGASLATVHASSGLEALKQIALLEKQLQNKRDFHVLGVSLLSSFSQNNLAPNLKSFSILKHVQSLVDLIVQAHLTGVVCSPHEVYAIKKAYPHLNVVTPGVRPYKVDKDDQERVMTPRQAMDKGACALVIGRPILHAKDPKKMVEQILKDLNS